MRLDITKIRFYQLNTKKYNLVGKYLTQKEKENYIKYILLIGYYGEYYAFQDKKGNCDILNSEHLIATKEYMENKYTVDGVYFQQLSPIQQNKLEEGIISIQNFGVKVAYTDTELNTIGNIINKGGC